MKGANRVSRNYFQYYYAKPKSRVHTLLIIYNINNHEL